MTRVAFLVSRLVRQGPITALVPLLGELRKHSVCPDIITLDGEQDVGITSVVERLGLRVLSLAAFRSLVQKGRKLGELTRLKHYAYVVSCGIRADLVNCLYVPSPKRVVIKQEPAFTPFGKDRFVTGFVRVSHLLIIARAERVVCVSEHVKASLPWVIRRKSTVILNSIDLSHFRPPSAEERAAARLELGIGSQQRVVLFVGSLDGRKRPQLLVNPIRELRREGLDVLLLLAGDGPLRAELDKVADGHEVRVVGFRDDIRPLYWVADLFVLPSSHEGMPMAALEALGCGLPVLLSDIPPHRELLAGWDKAGRLFNPLDVRECIQELRVMLTTSAGGEPRRLAEGRFGSLTVAKQLGHLLSSSATSSWSL